MGNISRTSPRGPVMMHDRMLTNTAVKPRYDEIRYKENKSTDFCSVFFVILSLVFPIV
jgi:hypothetical protein